MKRKDFVKNSTLLLGLGFLIPFYKPKPKKKLYPFSLSRKECKLTKRREHKNGMPDVYEKYLSRKNPKIEINRSIFKSKKNIEKLRPHLAKFINGYYKDGKLQKMRIKEMIFDDEIIDITPPGDTWFMSKRGKRRITLIVK